MSPAAFMRSSSSDSLWAGHEFSGRITRQRGRSGKTPRQPDRIAGNAAILDHREIVWPDTRRGARVWSARMGGAAARRPQVAHADRDRGKIVQWFAEPIERQGLHMELEVGGRIVGRGFGEHAKLRRRHGHRPAPAEGIVEANQRPLDGRAIIDVERARAFDAEDRSKLQMVLKVFANAGQARCRRERRLLQDVRAGRPLRAPSVAACRSRPAASSTSPPRAALHGSRRHESSEADGAAPIEQDPLGVGVSRRRADWAGRRSASGSRSAALQRRPRR